MEALDREGNGPSTLAATVEANPHRIDARPRPEVAQYGRRIGRIDVQVVFRRKLTRVASGRLTVASLVVGEHCHPQRGVQPNPDPVIDARPGPRAVNDDDSGMGGCGRRLSYGSG